MKVTMNTHRILAVILLSVIVCAPFTPSGASSEQPAKRTTKKIQNRPLLVVAGKGSDKDSAAKTTQDPPQERMAVPLYKPPRGMGRPWPTQGGGTRGDESCNPTIAVLAPNNHTGLTVQEQPFLYWYLSEVCQATVEFTVTEEDGITPLLERQLPTPVTQGIQVIALQDYNLDLEIGKRYQWSVALVFDPAHRSRDIIAMGGIERIAPPSNLVNMQGVNLTELPMQEFAEAGLWYDAVGSLSMLIERDPAPSLRQQRTALLKQVNLDYVDE